MKNIHIPEPCHENWADFTPTEKGGFCHSCSIDVVDFSNKSPEEIKQILKENTGKHMCGRFKKSQLEELNDSFYAWDNQSPRSFQSKFLYACLVVFGMSLFTSCNINEQHVLGEIAVEWNQDADNNQLNPFTPAAIQPIEKDTTKKPPRNELVKGKVAYIADEEDLPVNCTVPDTSEVQEIHVKGEIAYIEEDVLGNIVATEDTLTNVIEEDTLFDDMMIDGEISWTPEFEAFVEDTTSGPTSITSINETPSISIDPDISAQTIFESALFPNPASDITKVVLDVKQQELFNILLYAIDGKQVKSIYNGILSTGRQEFIVDLTSYKAGSYLIMIESNQQKASLRLEKL